MTDHWFACLSHEEVLARWPVIRELLAPACHKSGGELVVDDILMQSESGAYKIAIMGVCETTLLAIVLSIVTYPRLNALNIMAIGGTNVRVFAKQFMQVVIDYARDIGADCVQLACGGAEARLFKMAGDVAGYSGREAYTVYRIGV
jgi:hypothetical protein